MAAVVMESAHAHTPLPSPSHHAPAPAEGERQPEGEAVGDPATPGEDGQGGPACTESMEKAEAAGNTQEESEQTANENSSTSNTKPAEETNCQQQSCNGQAGQGVTDDDRTERDEYVDRVWDEFVTHFLIGSRHIQKAAIFDLASLRPLAVNGELRMSQVEVEQLAASLHHHQLAYRNGVTVGGKTYKVRLADGRNGLLARTDHEGCTACKTHTLIIIGVHDGRGSSRHCNEDVMRLGDFFRKKAL